MQRLFEGVWIVLFFSCSFHFLPGVLLHCRLSKATLETAQVGMQEINEEEEEERTLCYLFFTFCIRFCVLSNLLADILPNNKTRFDNHCKAFQRPFLFCKMRNTDDHPFASKTSRCTNVHVRASPFDDILPYSTKSLCKQHITHTHHRRPFILLSQGKKKKKKKKKKKLPRTFLHALQYLESSLALLSAKSSSTNASRHSCHVVTNTLSISIASFCKIAYASSAHNNASYVACNRRNSSEAGTKLAGIRFSSRAARR
jgi:hypothetical protein